MSDIKEGVQKALSGLPYKVMFITFTLLSLVIYYAVLISSTPWGIFVSSNNNFYIGAQVVLSIFNALLIGIVFTMFVYVLEKRRKESNLTIVQAFASLLFSVAATGCTVCGAVLLPTLGIAASLTALPFGGLEIKFLTILLLTYSIYEYSKIIIGKCDMKIDDALTIEKQGDGYYFDFNRKFIRYFQPFVVTIVFFGILLTLPSLPPEWKVDFSRDQKVIAKTDEVTNETAPDDLTDQINPVDGYGLGVSYNDIGIKTVESGAIDLEGFKQVYADAGQPLSDEQIKILTEGSDEEIVINRENSYFLLNFFWAFGLANENPILTEGPIAQYGDGQIGSFASTGGWSLASKELEDYYSSTKIVDLSPDQQEIVEETSSNIFRPCCGNSTYFPDCNHGMALLGIIELMAANGASETEIYEAAKYINSYWFPSTYNDLAVYFKSTEGLDFSDVDAKTLLSADYSSGSGWQSKKQWMQQQGILPEPPKTSGGGCGV